ncbi:MAG: dual specificity protein phosphatase [Candidatus Colwellbacteria bacterium]|nr:dual specificity protein phosphatase [Candidatus Colwellbacteria bacterium]
MEEKTQQSPADLNRITDNIWIGSDVSAAEHKEKVMHLSFDIDIGLERDQSERIPGVKAVVLFPVEESEEITPQQLAMGVNLLRDAVKKDFSVLIHSPFGRGRAPMMVAAYLTTTGMNPEQAMDFVRAKIGILDFSEQQKESLVRFAAQRNT